MGFKVADYSFMGAYPIDEMDDIKDWSGLYAILCRRGNRHYLIDVGESDGLKSELHESDRRELWEQNCSGTLVITVKYTMEMHQAERVRIERKIRKRHNPPCRKVRSLKL
jgi:hypothetical protein